MNYAEEMAYWYFRLNGFLPLTRFVLHRHRPEHDYNADSDLLGVRAPFVYEDVGGQPNDWDQHFFGHLAERGWNRERDWIAAIVEAKGGAHGRDPGDAFEHTRLVYGIRRLGFCASAQVAEDVAARLAEQPWTEVTTGGVHWKVVKVLAAHALIGGPRFGPLYYEFPLTAMDAFILDRMRGYEVEKREARHFFPGDLIQYYIWRAEGDRRHRQ